MADAPPPAPPPGEPAMAPATTAPKAAPAAVPPPKPQSQGNPAFRAMGELPRPQNMGTAMKLC